MATGFVERIKGKVKVDKVWIGSSPTAAENDVNSASTVGVMPNAGYINLSTLTTASGNVTLGQPYPGSFVTLGTTAATTGFAILASATGNITFGSTNFYVRFGSSTAGVVTAAMSFQGVSTTQWMPVGSNGVTVFTTA